MPRKRLASLTIGIALVAAACSSGGGQGDAVETEAGDNGSAAPTEEDPATEPDGAPTPEPRPLVSPTDSDEPFDLSTSAPRSDDGVTVVAEDVKAGLDDRVFQATAPWSTEWGRRSIDIAELQLGLPRVDPRDGIPPIDTPKFEPIGGAPWGPREPGALVQLGDDVRFYPLSIMTRHEIVNDRIGDVPVAVTFCPLCNTAIAFDRRVDGEVLRFGVSGLLRNSDLVMWDDSTLSLWQQITGEAVVGELAGTRLEFLSTSIVSYGDALEAFPDALSLSTDTGFGIEYGFNGYAEYSSSTTPFLFAGELDTRFPALSRVVGVSVEGGDKAYPFESLRAKGASNDQLGDTPIAVFWGGDTADALDGAIIAESTAIGSAIAYDRRVDGQTLTFSANGDDTFVDAETGSTWTLLGQATSGPLEGSQLLLVPHRNEFWFAWAAFFPDAPVYESV